MIIYDCYLNMQFENEVKNNYKNVLKTLPNFASVLNLRLFNAIYRRIADLKLTLKPKKCMERSQDHLSGLFWPRLPPASWQQPRLHFIENEVHPD